MESLIRRIVVVGGTAAGWTAAARLASVFGGTVSVTVLEPPSRPAGVSETGQVSAVPPELQRELFDRLGVPEEEWMRACRASFATAVRYADWRAGMAGASAAKGSGRFRADHFYRTCAPLSSCEEFTLLECWQNRRGSGETIVAFDYACFREPPLLDAGKSPRWMDGRAAVPYGWHIDTAMFTRCLRDLAMRRFGVRAVRDTPVHAERDADGMLTLLHTAESGPVPGDLFLDCTGDERLLMTGMLGEPFVDTDESPGCDSAVTVTVPMDEETHAIEPFTTVTALPDGWAWKMPLLGGFGAGRVYARDLTGPDEALKALGDLYGPLPRNATVRHSGYRTGRLRRSWAGNCVAVGRAAQVLEPLADDGLGEVLRQVGHLVRDFPALRDREAPAARYDRAVRRRHEAARDLAALRYAVAPGLDTPFWADRRARPLPDAVRESLAAYRAGLSPGQDTQEVVSYTLLASLLTKPPSPRPALAHRPAARREADALFLRVARQQQILLETLPTAQEYLRRLHNRPPSVAADPCAAPGRHTDPSLPPVTA
ncbi:tryptophan 7-halogenase [Streptomyces sp. NBC_01789]|uniref:tryptophan 7-halogenase n=1 Tax=Streptomyces sp. NBC_01789 TaxID=2975941 RepID=UPI00224FDC54|nr:tryptophan 7-halogenase [Streptomyces sp. NBC_01789]MCX4446041.1 tryptophan 7-halogenase [Streptomyces sp. NBC_01789]